MRAEKLEAFVVYCVTAVIPLILLFVLFWWISAALAINQVIRFPEKGIAAAAITGGLLGMTLDILYLRKWAAQFYTVNLRIVAAIYLCCSVVAVAFFMGLPVGNLILGTLAGIYTGRRMYYAAEDPAVMPVKAHQAGVFAAVVTGLEALPIGLLALNEDWVVAWLQRVTRMGITEITGFAGIGLIILLCAVLMAIQFWCTKTAAKIAYGRST